MEIRGPRYRRTPRRTATFAWATPWHAVLSAFTVNAVWRDSVESYFAAILVLVVGRADPKTAVTALRAIWHPSQSSLELPPPPPDDPKPPLDDV